jgi:DNA-binding CsgD family transcriptional regulator/tetratricopeptide (TPR) repeat protein
MQAAGVLAFRQGDYPAAHAHLETALRLARMAGDHACLTEALRSVGRMAIDCDELAAARPPLEESLRTERELGEVFGTAWSLNYLGLLLHLEGDNDGAWPALQESLASMRALGDQWGIAGILHTLGRVALDRDEIPAACAYFAECLSVCRARGYIWLIPYLLQAFACVAVTCGWPLEAGRLAGAAQALHEAIGAPLPRLWQADLKRRLEPAQRMLNQAAWVRAWREGRDLSLEQGVTEALSAGSRAERALSLGNRRAMPTEDQASAPGSTLAAAPPDTRHTGSSDTTSTYEVLRHGSGPQASAVDGGGPVTGRVDPLTPREREVALLLTRGFTNRQIGDELVISAATAERHVVNIFNKLGFHSRSQLAAWVVERGLGGHRPS